jgi:hypothetical protein
MVLYLRVLRPVVVSFLLRNNVSWFFLQLGFSSHNLASNLFFLYLVGKLLAGGATYFFFVLYKSIEEYRE